MRPLARLAQRAGQLGSRGEALLRAPCCSSRATIAATAGLTPLVLESIAGGGSETCLSATATGLSPLNGSLPVSIW